MIKNKEVFARWTVAVLLISVLCVACRSAAPPVSFYKLSAVQGSESMSSPQPLMKDILIGVGPLQFPDYLDRPQIVVRSGSHRLEMSEFNRWAGRLDRDFLTVFAENLSILLSTDRVIVHPWKPQENPDFRIEVNVNQFEAQTEGQVLLKATWTVRGRDSGGDALHIARSVISKPLPGPASGQDYDALVAAYSQALADLSREVSVAIPGIIKHAEISTP